MITLKTIDYWIQIKKIPACFGKYNYRIADCQRQDLGICAVCESYTKLENTLIDYKDKLHRRNMQIKNLKEKIEEIKHWAENSTNRLFIVEHKLSKIPIPNLYVFYNKEEAQRCKAEKEKNPSTCYVTITKFIPSSTIINP